MDINPCDEIIVDGRGLEKSEPLTAYYEKIAKAARDKRDGTIWTKRQTTHMQVDVHPDSKRKFVFGHAGNLGFTEGAWYLLTIIPRDICGDDVWVLRCSKENISTLFFVPHENIDYSRAR